MVTAEKTMDEFEKLLEESFSKQHAVADIVEGTVMKTVADGLSFFLFNEKINRKMKSKRKLLQLEMCWGIFFA